LRILHTGKDEKTVMDADILKIQICRGSVRGTSRRNRKEDFDADGGVTYLLTYGAEPFLRSRQLCSH
jgi:hypothetical protein